MRAVLSEMKSGRLRSIDALRGIAALGVVVYHSVGQYPTTGEGFFNSLAASLQYLFKQGYSGVFLFFIISGFCIHLQWAKARQRGEDFGISFGAFWKRRLRRLYPPYLIALALYLAANAYIFGQDLTHFFIYDVVMHLLMLHNLDSHTSYSITAVFWTLAVEEQLYLAYFLLLFVRMRKGWKWALMACALARVGWYLLSYTAASLYHVNIPVDEAAASHWLTWAMGAIGVEAWVGLIKLPQWCRKLPIAFAALVSAVVLTHVFSLVDKAGLAHHLIWLAIHPMWGLGFFILVNHFVNAEAGWRDALSVPSIVKLMAGIGIFSYSLYLTHQLFLLASRRFIFSEWPPMMNILLIITPMAVGFAWLFFRFCERPYMKPPTPAVKTELATDSNAPAQDVASA